MSDPNGSNSAAIRAEIRVHHEAVTALELERTAVNAKIREHRAAVENLTGDKKAFAWARHLASLDNAEKATTHKVAFDICCEALGIGAPERLFDGDAPPADTERSDGAGDLDTAEDDEAFALPDPERIGYRDQAGKDDDHG